MQKFKRVWGGRPDGKPKKYVVAVADLEDFGASLYKDKAKKRSMVKLNQKAFNSVYPKIKKANVKLAEEIAEYKKVRRPCSSSPLLVTLPLFSGCLLLLQVTGELLANVLVGWC